jgi:DNA-binding transcriptional ArsR family regulator
MNSQEALEIVAKDKDIKGETYRVLFFICARLDFENWVQISITEIANELDLKQPSASRAIKVLEEKEIILRGPKLGRSFAFRLNPEFGWKGKVKHLDDYRQSDQDLTAAHRENQKKKLKETLTVVEPTKEQQLIRAIQEREVDIDKLYQFLCQEKAGK